MSTGNLRPLTIAGNWKLHKTSSEAEDFCAEMVTQGVTSTDRVRVMVAPPFTSIPSAHRAIAGAAIALAGQDTSCEDQGAFTGEVSVPMLRDVGCSHVLVGHSERRQLFGDDDTIVGMKLAAAWRGGLTPILCLGETAEQRDQGRTEAQVLEQLEAALAVADAADAGRLLLAYEPIWAIGTGRVAAPSDAQAVHAALRTALHKRFGALGRSVPILYGGSVKPENAKGLFLEQDIDGALVGGASLDFAAFSAIVHAARNI